MRKSALLVAGLMVALPAFAGQISERPDRVALTVYHSGVDYERGDPREFRDPQATDGLAFITETRTIDVPAGPAVIEFRGVASTIVPQTAAVEGLPVEILERNFDYDLLSPGSLLAKSIGNAVTLVRTDKKTGKQTEQKAIVRSGPGGVVLDFGGKFEALKCSGMPEKLVFDRVPDGLRDTPTLSIRTNAPSAGRYTVKLHYIAGGMNWAANYVARVRPDGKSFDLTGWVTLINGGETGFTGVPLDIVAGHLETDDDSVPVEPAKIYAQTGCWPTDVNWWMSQRVWERLHQQGNLTYAMSVKRSAVEVEDSLETVVVTGFRAAVELGDYKLYSLAQPTDVLARQTKQIQFVDSQNVPFQRYYYFMIEEEPGWRPAGAAVRFTNTKEARLGLPLPAGFFAMSQDDPDHPAVLLGRANFADTSVGLPVELGMGDAQDIYVEQRVVSREQTGGIFSRDGTRTTLDITIQNNKTAAVDFELYQPLEDGLEVVSEPSRHISKRYGMTWLLKIGAGENRTVRLVFERTL